MNYTYSKPNCVNVTELRRDGISFPKKTHGSVREDWKQYNQTLDNESSVILPVLDHSRKFQISRDALFRSFQNCQRPPFYEQLLFSLIVI